MHTTAMTLDVLSGGQSQKVALSTTHAETTAITQPITLPAGQPVRCQLALDAAGFIRRGTNPVALSDGTDQYIPANTLVFVHMMAGEKLSIILASGTGNAYFTPNV